MQGLKKSGLFVLMVVLAAAWAVLPAQAQMGVGERVEIPFDFSAGNTAFKAGTYTVTEMRPGIFSISSLDRRENGFALSFSDDSANRSHQAHLVFARYGSEMFLEKVFLSGEDGDAQLVRSSREKELMRSLAAGEQFSLLLLPAR